MKARSQRLPLWSSTAFKANPSDGMERKLSTLLFHGTREAKKFETINISLKDSKRSVVDHSWKSDSAMQKCKIVLKKYYGPTKNAFDAFLCWTANCQHIVRTLDNIPVFSANE